MKPTFVFSVSFFLCILGFSSNGFSQWIQVPNPVGVYCLTVNGPDVFAGSFDTNGVWISTDHGASWSARGDSAFGGVYSLAFMGSNMFAGTYEKGVWRSTDLGKSWAHANSGIAAQDVYGLAAMGTHLTAIGLGGIFLSNDSGSTWARTSNKYAFESSATPLAVGGSYMYAATVEGLVRSADSGATWITLLDSMYWAVAADDSNVFASNDTGFYRSTDNGTSWKMSSPNKFGLTYINGKNIFAGPARGNDVTCYVSTDLGTSWIDLNQDSRSTSLVVSGPNIIKGSNNSGIWYRPLPNFLQGAVKPSTPDPSISLSPNPTQGMISVRNAPAHIIHVTISNLLGESMLELTHPNAPDFPLDLSKLPPGTYIARFSLPDEVMTRKIMKE